MKIGEASAASGCHIETIRYYERQGLLAQPARTGAGYRQYTKSEVERLRFVTRGRELGFSLAEIRSLLRLAEDPKLSCVEVDLLARQHLLDVQMRVKELRRIERELKRTIGSCARNVRAECAILSSLATSPPRNTGKGRSASKHTRA